MKYDNYAKLILQCRVNRRGHLTCEGVFIKEVVA